jgi:hypothetical protein
MKFNPKLKGFMEENEDLSVLGLFWAGLWRFYAIVFALSIVISLLSKLF